MTPKADDLTDAERIDPAFIKRWYCLCAYKSTIVLATNYEEACAVAAYWFGRVARWKVQPSDVKAKLATEEQISKWLAARAQEKAGVR